jgi:hypothetical protein
MSSSVSASDAGASFSSSSSSRFSALLDPLREFCEQQGLKTDKVLALTIQKNRTTEFSSLIVNFTSGNILEVYPDRDACSIYKEGRLNNGPTDYLYCYNDALPIRGDENELILGASKPSTVQPAAADREQEQGPFCCTAIQSYKPRATAHDTAFQSLRDGRGHHPNLVFEVVTQVDNGPILSTKYFKVEDNQRKEIRGETFTQKVHAFKNYKCGSHRLFYAVNLYRPNGAGSGSSVNVGSNYHHMRLNPHTKVNEAFLTQFFKETLQPSKQQHGY